MLPRTLGWPRAKRRRKLKHRRKSKIWKARSQRWPRDQASDRRGWLKHNSSGSREELTPQGIASKTWGTRAPSGPDHVHVATSCPLNHKVSTFPIRACVIFLALLQSFSVSLEVGGVAWVLVLPILLSVLGLPCLPNENMIHPVKLEFQIKKNK